MHNHSVYALPYVCILAPTQDLSECTCQNVAGFSGFLMPTWQMFFQHGHQQFVSTELMPTRVSKFANVLIFAIDKITSWSHSCIILYKDMRLQGDHTALHQHGSLQQETARSTNKQKVYLHFSLAHPGCITQRLQARCGAQTLAKNTLSGISMSND